MYEIIVNGIGHAFLQEFGCPCDRCTTDPPKACTSVSIVSRDERKGTVDWHALVDVGPGVVDSVCHHVDPPCLDLLLLTHWHPDHVLDLNRLCESANTHLGMPKVPMWCTQATADKVKDRHSFEYKYLLEPKPADAPVCQPPGTPLPEVGGLNENLTIQPFTVSHSTADSAKKGIYACASFVVKTKQAKAVLLWDIDGNNDWLRHDDQNQELQGADYLLIDCNTWKVDKSPSGKPTGHATFQNVVDYAECLKPTQTLLVHLSGHEDKPDDGYGWSDQRWEKEAGQAWERRGLEGSVRVPCVGDRLRL